MKMVVSLLHWRILESIESIRENLTLSLNDRNFPRLRLMEINTTISKTRKMENILGVCKTRENRKAEVWSYHAQRTSTHTQHALKSVYNLNFINYLSFFLSDTCSLGSND